MKTVFLYSGQTRTFGQLWENHRWHLRHYSPDAVIASVADDAQADDIYLIRQAYPKAQIFIEKVKQPEIPEPVERSKWVSGCPRTVPVQAVLKQLWALNRVWDFAQECIDVKEYDLFLRLRCDSAFMRVENIARRGRSAEPLLCMTPQHSRWGGVNDRFAILGRIAASVYFSTFRVRESLWSDGCPLHPEQMIAYRLEESCIKVDDSLKADFFSLRLDGSIDPQTFTMVDLADAR